MLFVAGFSQGKTEVKYASGLMPGAGGSLRSSRSPPSTGRIRDYR